MLWSEDVKTRASELFREGRSNGEIAEALGTTNQKIGSLLHRLGLSRPDPTLGQKVLRNAALRNPKTRAKAPNGHKTLEERGPNECAWPFGESPSITFCCQPRAERNGEPTEYCEMHGARMWRHRVATDE
jgi:hypothetical protein